MQEVNLKLPLKNKLKEENFRMDVVDKNKENGVTHSKWTKIYLDELKHVLKKARDNN